MLPEWIPELRTHYISSQVTPQVRQSLSSDLLARVEGRSMIVKRVKVLPIESIVRGYISGSAWSSYQQSGTVCDIGLPPGLLESEKLERPLWTPSTKAEVGGSDENISPAKGNWPMSRALRVVPSNWSIESG